MALTPCKDCGRQISTSAETCPGCGRQIGDLPWFNLIVVLVVVLWVSWLIWWPAD
ncbi:MAG: hypothetical protein GWM98_13605 [Nitrospinaceae bacterium]|nr:hypothetical protein [Nitrospinaceae bacterium]